MNATEQTEAVANTPNPASGNGVANEPAPANVVAGTPAPNDKEVRIRHFKVSFIWVQTTIDPIRRSPDDIVGQVDHRLHNINSYQAEFRRARAEAVAATKEGRPIAGELRVPWEAYSTFWKHYLRDNKDPNNPVVLSEVTTERVIKNLVPLRAALPTKRKGISAVWMPAKPSGMAIEAYVYPHGIALVAAATVMEKAPGPGFTLDRVVEIAMQIKKGGKFRVAWQQSGTVETLNFHQLINKCMDIVLRERFAPGTPVVRKTDIVNPFTVLTIVEGEGVDPKQPIQTGGDIHKALRAAAQLTSSNYQNNDPEENLAKAFIPTQKSVNDAKGRTLYGTNRGRVIWFPNSFSPVGTGAEKKPRLLSCFHKNLVFACMQVESLSNLVEALLAHNEPLSPVQVSYARRAINMLRLMYAADPGTYQSCSPAWQMFDNGTIGSINALQDALVLNMESLPVTKPTMPER